MQLRAAWAGAVVATTLIGLMSGSVFVLAQVFGEDPAAAPPAPVTTTTVTQSPAEIWTDQSATVVGVRVGKKDPRAVVMVVALPAGCSRNLHARVTRETSSMLEVRAVLQARRNSCRVISRTIAATARAPLAGRTVVVNGQTWTPAPNGGYRP